MRWSCGFYLFFCWCSISHWLIVYVGPSLLRWNESNLIIMYILFMCCCILFADILLRILHLYFSKILACNFFFGSVFVWFWYQGDSGFIKWLWECSLLLSLLEEFEKDLCKFFIGLLEFPYEAIYGPELLFAGSFFFFNYRFYFTSTGQSLQIMYFFFGGLLYF